MCLFRKCFQYKSLPVCIHLLGILQYRNLSFIGVPSTHFNLDSKDVGRGESLTRK